MFSKSMFNSEGKIKAVSFRISWSEGITLTPGELEDVEFSSWQELSQATQGIAINDTTTLNGGYCKTKFSITFADGFEYEGRLDIQSNGEDADSGQHIIDWCLFNTGNKPSWMTDEQYAQVYSKEVAAEYQNIIDTYELIAFPIDDVVKAHEAKINAEIEAKREAARLIDIELQNEQALIKEMQYHNSDAPVKATGIKRKKTKWNPDPDGSGFNADIYPGEKIRVWGNYDKRDGTKVYFDNTFTLGNRVQYESRHWGNYYGNIVKISKKTVTVEAEYSSYGTKRLDLHTFITENLGCSI